MAKVAIVSYDVQTIFGKAGGVGAFTTRWANLLRALGEDVTIVMTRIDWGPMRVDTHWRARYQADGIGLIELQAPPPSATRWPEVAAMRMSEIAAPVLRGFDLVYVQDWANAAFHLVRERRYAVERGPVCVTVLHGPSEWGLSTNGRYPELPADAHLAWLERYAARHSDFVVSPSRYMAEHLAGLGWQFPGEVAALGLPMPEPEPAAAATPEIRKIVYFGRVEERKGIRNFVAALQHLAKDLKPKPAIVLLGGVDHPPLLDSALRDIRGAGFAVSHEASLDTEAAARYLRERAHETLCVVPSPSDNFPYAVIEASLIPGLNLIACRGGGVPEILKDGRQLCDPWPRELAAKIAETLRAPLAPSELTRYDCRSANAQWLAFHEKALAAKPSRERTGKKLTVDVCVTYYQKAPYFGQLIDALEQQTETDFHVIAVNDGSPDEASNRVFEEQSERVRGRGWDFYRQENAFVDAARNGAARRGSGDLILFVDADDVPARNAIARMREAISICGDDALICGSYLFASEGAPCDPETGAVLTPPYAICVPLGMDLVGGLVNPCAFGGSMFMVRRSAFEAIGGFTERRGAGHEDWELYVRLALAGYRVDVVPDLLQFYRQVEGSLARTLPSEASLRRLLDAYEDALGPVGLKGAALALAGLHRGAKEAEQRLRRVSLQAEAPEGEFAFFSGERFEPDSPHIDRMRRFYRSHVSLENRLKFHRIFLAPFFGANTPPEA
jgi:glycosyltransferase involved in cell wall biosynthesis